MKNSQNLAETIETLSKEKGVSVSSLLQELEMNKNALFTMKKSGYLPRVESLCKFADYFQCSLDYLVGRTDNPEIISTGKTTSTNDIQEQLDKTTAEFMQLFQSLDISDKIAVMNLTLEKSKKV